jgi:GT2 family glycosyltransferase
VTGDRGPRVGAVVVSFNTRDLLLQCLESLYAHAGVPLAVVVVDNASTDGSAAAARARFPAATVIESPANVGFSRANNLGLAAVGGTYVLVLNSDCQVRPGTVPALCAVLDAQADAGIVGPRTVGADGRPQVSFGPALTPLAEWRQGRLVRGVRKGDPAALRQAEALLARPAEPSWVSASCLLARRTALEAVGGFDESFFLYEEDVDLCLRVRRAGWRIVFTPSASVVHHLGRSMEQSPALARFEYHRSHLLYYRKHNPPGQRALLRAWMAGRAVWGWLRAGTGERGRRRRAEAIRVLRLALLG